MLKKTDFCAGLFNFMENVILIRVLLMKLTKVTKLPQSGEGTMHEVPRLRTKVKPHLYQFVRVYRNCDFEEAM